MAREQYLLHAGEDTIHRPGEDKKPETPKKKWENFWYYHRLHILIAVVVAVVAGVMIRQSLQTVKPDYTVGLITQAVYPSADTDALQAAMQKYGKDLNGDGKVAVEVVQYTVASSASAGTSSGLSGADPQMQAAMQVKLTADLSTGTSMIFLTDDASFRKLQSDDRVFACLDGSTPEDTAADYGRMRVPLAECGAFRGLSLTGTQSGGGTEGLGISLRVYKGSAVEGKADAYYRDSKELFDKLTRGS